MVGGIRGRAWPNVRQAGRRADRQAGGGKAWWCVGGTYEKVPWLEVSMHHIGGVEKLETPEELIDEELDVVVGQGLRRLDDTAQVRLHKLAYDVEVTEPVPMQGLEDGL